jgi:hypothetical protein
MYLREFVMKQLILFCTLILFATTGLAAKQEKALICHMGNEAGLGGETYLDDPTCVPSDVNGFFCPDAGKVDLIVVAKADKHLNNDSHSWDGISDYEPSEVGASGDGTEDSDGDGIDDGCEPADICPCWDVAELQAVTAANHDPVDSCSSFTTSIGHYPESVALSTISSPGAVRFQAFEPYWYTEVAECYKYNSDATSIFIPVSDEELAICVNQIADRCAAIGDPIAP